MVATRRKVDRAANGEIPRRVKERRYLRPKALVKKGGTILLFLPRAIPSSLRFWHVRLPAGTPCYALVWEGSIGAFYEIDERLNITLLADVMKEPGHRYALLYGLVDPTFDKNGGYSRHSDAGKLMALASYSIRTTPSAEEQKLIDFLLQPPPSRTSRVQ